jgi:tRNA (guanine37-N1)-methyltransferase
LRKRLREKLSEVLADEQLKKVYNSFDIVGDIAIFKHNKVQNPEFIAKQIMAIHKNIKTVLTPVAGIDGDFRIRELVHLVGETKTITTHKESGCKFKIDLEKCYFSPRLSYEHKRISQFVFPSEIIVNMFAGVGCFSILIAKTQNHSKVFSIDINPAAVEYMKENIKINCVNEQVVPMLGDSKDVIKTHLQGIADRVLMPLPEKAFQYLPFALLALKKTGGWIHYYDFQHAVGQEDPAQETTLKVTEKLDCLGVRYGFFSSRVVRPTGPNWFQTVLDIQITELPSKF